VRASRNKFSRILRSRDDASGEERDRKSGYPFGARERKEASSRATCRRSNRLRATSPRSRVRQRCVIRGCIIVRRSPPRRALSRSLSAQPRSSRCATSQHPTASRILPKTPRLRNLCRALERKGRTREREMCYKRGECYENNSIDRLTTPVTLSELIEGTLVLSRRHPRRVIIARIIARD